MNIITENIDSQPYTGIRKVRGNLRLSEKEWLDNFYNGAENTEQVTGVTRGKIYEVQAVEGFGDGEDITFTNDNGEVQTLGSWFFEEV